MAMMLLARAGQNTALVAITYSRNQHLHLLVFRHSNKIHNIFANLHILVLVLTQHLRT